MTRQILSFALLTACTLAATAVHAGAAAPVVELRMSSRFVFAPATLRVTVIVEPNADNRTLQLEVDGDAMFSASEMNLEGDGEKRVHEFYFSGLPAGQYTIQAEVRSAHAVRGSATQDLSVISRDR